MITALVERERGKTNTSIGTSLALESALNIHDDIRHQKMPLLEFEELWINIKTLFRNLYGAVAREYHDILNGHDVAKELIAEMEIIKDICRNDAQSIKPIFYVCDYSGLENTTSETLMRMDNTPLQKAQTELLRDTLNYLSSYFQNQDQGTEILKFKNKITMLHNKPSALMLSHYAYDLTSWREFRKLILLESHTGALKGMTQWYTKYYNGRDMVNIPFRLDLLTLLGDQTLFRNKTSAVKREILRMAVDDKWSSITTASKIRAGAKEIKNHVVRDKILSSIIGM